MSLITVSVGQFGNQISGCFYRYLKQDRPFAGQRYLFDENGMARAVLVDGEAKVICKLLREKDTPFKSDKANFEQSGRGNNWALGYYGRGGENGMCLVELTMEALRVEMEACDAYRGCLMLHSLCGGTGSGLGSRLAEEIRDELGGGSYLFSGSVLPFAIGELPLQNYNAALCISRVCRALFFLPCCPCDQIKPQILEETDSAILFSNDNLLAACQRTAARRDAAAAGAAAAATVTPAQCAAATVQVDDLNAEIGMALAGLLQPCV
jgi:hypothetical protein